MCIETTSRIGQQTTQEMGSPYTEIKPGERPRKLGPWKWGRIYPFRYKDLLSITKVVTQVRIQGLRFGD
jgi:hypothetical protein